MTFETGKKKHGGLNELSKAMNDGFKRGGILGFFATSVEEEVGVGGLQIESTRRRQSLRHNSRVIRKRHTITSLKSLTSLLTPVAASNIAHFP